MSILASLLCLSLVVPVALTGPSTESGAANVTASAKSTPQLNDTQEPLVPFAGSVASESAPPPSGQIGFDMGTNAFSFSGSKISWARSTGNMTVSPVVSVNASSVTFELTPTTEKNSTLIDFSYSHDFGVSSFSQNLLVKNTSNSYDREIVLSGSLGGPTATITEAIQLENLANFPASVCDSGCTQQCFGTMCFDWTGDQATFNNATDVVTFILGPNFSIDPLALDGSGKCALSAVTSSCTITFTPSNANDVIVVGCGLNVAGAGSRHCITPTATGLTFSFRTWKQNSGSNNMTEWYAIKSTASIFTVTCKESANGLGGCTSFGISNANTAAPYDSGAPASNSGTNSKPTVSTISTTNPNDILIGLTEDAGTVQQTSGTCASGTCTLITTGTAAPVVASEYLVVSSTLSSGTVAFGTSTGSGNTWAMIADAIKAYVTQPITCTTANSAPSATMTLSGASVSPTTLACDGTAHNFTADPSQVITITVPTDLSTSRYRLASLAMSTTVTTCATGTCTGDSFTIYYQFSQSVSYALNTCDSGATCSAPNLSYTQSGSSTNSALTTSASTYWIDYNTNASVPNPYTDSLGDAYYPYTSSSWWIITGANVVNTPIVYWCGL